MDNVKHHTLKKHAHLSLDQARLKRAIEDVQATDDLIKSMSGPRTVVHGLAVHDALSCHHCGTIYKSEKKMREHYSKIHDDRSSQGWRSCKAQQLTPDSMGHACTFWEVLPAQQPEDIKARLVEDLLCDLARQLDVTQVQQRDERIISPWLMTTRWREYIASLGSTTSVLRAQVAIPKDNDPELGGLSGAVLSYFEEATRLLDSTDEIVLMHLNSPDPEKWQVISFACTSSARTLNKTLVQWHLQHAPAQTHVGSEPSEIQPGGRGTPGHASLHCRSTESADVASASNPSHGPTLRSRPTSDGLHSQGAHAGMDHAKQAYHTQRSTVWHDRKMPRAVDPGAERGFQGAKGRHHDHSQADTLHPTGTPQRSSCKGRERSIVRSGGGLSDAQAMVYRKEQLSLCPPTFIAASCLCDLL